MVKQFTGTGVALITPFHNYGTIDFTSLGKIIKHVIRNGVNFLVVLGTTGESVTLSKDEKMAVMDYVIDTVDDKLPIVMGVGGNNTQEITDFVKSYDFKGVSAILSVAPYYNKPQQKGLYYHFKNIAAASPVPVILYNVPGRTSSNISSETTLKLAYEFKNIVGIKEASGDFGQIMRIIKDKPRDFSVLSGDDALTYPLLMCGADGVISVTANLYPKEFAYMVENGLKGSRKKSREVHFSLLEIMEALFEDGSPSGIKAALNIKDLCQNNLRMPLVKVNKATFNKIQVLMEGYEFPIS